MAHAHPSTAHERVEIVSGMLAHKGTYGYVTTTSRQQHVSRQSLYRWTTRAQAALITAFTPDAVPPPPSLSPRAVLTLLVEAHASESGIQRCLAELLHHSAAVGRISQIITEAGQRAVALLAHERPPAGRATAPGTRRVELFGADAHHAYLSIVDATSAAVWLTAGPVTADADSWTLLEWEAAEQGLGRRTRVTDGGSALHEACRTVDPQGERQRDVWHVLHSCSRVQGRLDRRVAGLEQQTPTVARQADRVAAGKKPQGRYPAVDLPRHLEHLHQIQDTAAALRYLSEELHRLLDVVVVDREGILDAATRNAELTTWLELLALVRDTAPEESQTDLRRLHTGLERALPELLTFVWHLEPMQQASLAEVGPQAVATIGWAWQRREALGLTAGEILAYLPSAWEPTAAALMTAWKETVRATSLAESWHSILRPHLAVHRALGPGLLALIAVWHNHRVRRRGRHMGTSPLQRSGLVDAEPDWLTALGYPPAGNDACAEEALALAA